MPETHVVATEEVPEQQKRCQEMIDKAMQSNVVRQVRNGMADLGCGTPRPFFTCKPCHPNESIIGGFTPDNPQVVVCSDNVEKFNIQQSHVTRTIAHELVHAFDHCRSKMDWKNCAHIACSEVRAARLSGDCDMDSELHRRNFKVASQGQRCAQRRAVLSVAGHQQCAEIAEKVVSEVFERCYQDEAPFIKA